MSSLQETFNVNVQLTLRERQEGVMTNLVFAEIISRKGNVFNNKTAEEYHQQFLNDWVDIDDEEPDEVYYHFEDNGMYQGDCDEVEECISFAEFKKLWNIHFNINALSQLYD